MSEKQAKENRRAERTKSLTVFERLLLRNILPELSGWNFDSMKEARELMESLFDEQEGEKLQIKVGEDGKGITWKAKDDTECFQHNRELWSADWKIMCPEDKEALPDVPCTCVSIPQEKELRISEGLTSKIQKFLKQLNDQEKLEFQHYTLYTKFIGD